MSVNTLPIESMNYGTVPTLLETPHVLWAQLRFPPPCNFKVSEKVAILDENDRILGIFLIDDIVGTRIILWPVIHDTKIRQIRKCSNLLSNAIYNTYNNNNEDLYEWLTINGESSKKLAYVA